MYKVNMSCLKPFAQKCMSNHIHIREVCTEDIVSHAQPIVQLNLNDVIAKELELIQVCVV